MNRLLLVRHNQGPADDRVASFLAARGASAVTVHPFAGEDLPDVDGFDGVVIYGGPFAVYEEARYPFLLAEARLIEATLARDLPLLGICQGAQQIARVLGAHVGPHPQGLHEFGYYEVTPTPAGRDILPGPLMLAQSHYHGFDLPAGAELLARSAAYPHQAFRYGSAYGFQFHAEVTEAGLRRWQAAEWAAFGKPGAQTRAEQDRLLATHDAAQNDWFLGFLARLFGPALSQSGVAAS